ncbi:EAL domain-containing protein [Aliivibrio sp. S3MY1]|uniref:EAL domain-containing protein n=1 Tax=unclassified Aliivibrio TaxID=2645654 RepID=UPI002378CD9D|nr:MULTISPECIES: EAL domain-containing protein [unclassified Aliivibrio]MDD9194257.1 EAL domain-containing protein [Aliivibrio sp. S3MY1]MDD9197924.1 EAL domain-containing protein [Aliivibrio sp. S2MY1]
MNIKHVKCYSYLICSVSLMIIFSFIYYTFYNKYIEMKVDEEHEEVRSIFNSVVNDREGLINILIDKDPEGIEQQLNLIRYVSENKDVSSISVVLDSNYLYSTFGNRDNQVEEQVKEGFNIKLKSSLTYKPIISYAIKVDSKTYLKVYFKPMKFNVINGFGRGCLIILDDIQLGEKNELIKYKLKDKENNHYFTLNDAEFHVEINNGRAIKEFIFDKYGYLILSVIVYLMSCYFLGSCIKRMWVKSLIRRNVIKPYLQPIVNAEGEIIGAEVLSRWITKDNEILPPNLFIPYIEENKLTPYLTKSLMEQLYKDLASIENKSLKLSFNLTEDCLFDQEVYKASLLLVSKCKLILEFTESAPFSHPKVKERMELFSNEGVFFALDDYGTGYSAPHYLTDYHFDYLKIDRCFVEEIEHNAKSLYIIESLVFLANKLKFQLIVEGVETVNQKTALLNSGINEFQGFLFYKPMPMKLFFELYAK